MILVIQTILPVVILIAFGFMLGKFQLFDKAATEALIRFSVRIVVPVAIFRQAMATPLSQLSGYDYIAALAVALIGMYAFGFAFWKIILRGSARDSIVKAACVSYPNMALLGLPIYTGIVGQHFAAMNVAVGNVITGLTIVPVMMAMLASSALAEGERRSIPGFVWGALKPPLVWLPILGFALPQLGVPHLPAFIDSPLKLVGQANVGLGLICLGLILYGQRFHFDRVVAMGVLLKLAVMPLIMLGLASVFAVHGEARLALMLVAVTPTASSMATIATEYHSDSARASATVLLTTLLSLIAFPAVQFAFS